MTSPKHFQAPSSSEVSETVATFPVVGIGASAGGLAPLEELFSHLPSTIEMSFIVVQHSDPNHETLLPGILSRRTELQVDKAQEGAKVEARHVYVAPSDAILSIENGIFHLTPREKTHEPILSIDMFLRSLASEYQHRAIGIVLSGTGSDGTLGLREIKEKGGVTFAQDEKTAKFYSMPQSAAASGSVDFVLSPAEMASHLENMAGHRYLASDIPLPPDNSPDLRVILSMIREGSGIDFSEYKTGTVSRRILRRMALYNIDTLSSFRRFLSSNPEVIEALAQDILIQVTKFFREHEAFDLLKTKVFPSLLEKKETKDPIRIWVPGCSSGEEVYSVLIALTEFLEDSGRHCPVQFFGTDLSDAAIKKARAATYVENISIDVSPERLRRFFRKVAQGYQISKSLRDLCIFARHNIVSDPPFGRIDLITCRNVLIYLDVPLQQRALSIFHYALNPGGILVLGKAETVGNATDRYSIIDSRAHIYLKKPLQNRLYFDFAGVQQTAKKIALPSNSLPSGDTASRGLQMQRDADRYCLNEFVPASVLVSDKLELVQFRGKTGLYFEHSPGFANLDLLNMLKEGLVTEVRNALSVARGTNQPVRKEDIRFRSNGDMKRVAIEIVPRPLSASGEKYFLILFEDMDLPNFSDSKQRRAIKKTADVLDSEVGELVAVRAELSSTKEYLQSVSEEKEATNEELKAANEEIMSSNEELQSTNEELHSAKEELQSTNEELLTVNEELKLRNYDLSHLNDDLANLFSSLNSAMVLLTRDLKVRRFTPLAETLLRLLPADIGRSISDIRPNVDINDMEKMLLEVIATELPKELEVEDHQGKWYSVQMKPYRTSEDKVDGAVLLFSDITTLKTSLIYSEAVESIVGNPLLVLSGDLKVKRANRSFYENFKTVPNETEDHFLYNIGDGQWNIPELKKLLEEILPKNSEISNYRFTWNFPSLGKKTISLNGRRLFYRNTATETILLNIEIVPTVEKAD